MENRNTFYKMTKTTTHINCPKQWEGEDDYSSHKPMLWLVLSKTEGQVVEFGCGEGSTMELAKECAIQDREFLSYENSSLYGNKYKGITAKIFDYTDIEVSNPSVLFIDSAPGEQRKDLIELHKDNADVIVVHDTEEGAQNIYGIREVLNSFKYRLNYYPKGNPGTTALSNKINVCEWV